MINFTKVARDVGVDTKTIQNYFQILDDTLVGYLIPAYAKSKRKSVGLQPKFYFFDLGVKRSLDFSIRQNLNPQTTAYGHAFEHFIFCEVIRMNSYSRSDYSIHHYYTNAGGEIDLILSRGREVIAIEIKSTKTVQIEEVRKLKNISTGLKTTRIIYVSQDHNENKIEGVDCLFWKDFLQQVFILN